VSGGVLSFAGVLVAWLSLAGASTITLRVLVAVTLAFQLVINSQ
jgi:hypothetical protein